MERTLESTYATVFAPKAPSGNYYSEPVTLRAEGLSLLHMLDFIAGESDISLTMLFRMAEHQSADVRSAVVENPNTTEAVQWKLSQDTDPNVRYALAENPRVSASVLEFLIEDENPYVSCRAKNTLERIKNEKNSRHDLLERIRVESHPAPLRVQCTTQARGESRSETRRKILAVTEQNSNNEKLPMVMKIKKFLHLLGGQC